MTGSFQVIHCDTHQQIAGEVIARPLEVCVAQDVGCALRVIKILQLVDGFGWMGIDMHWSLGIDDVWLVNTYHWDAFRYDSVARLFDDLEIPVCVTADSSIVTSGNPSVVHTDMTNFLDGPESDNRDTRIASLSEADRVSVMEPALWANWFIHHNSLNVTLILPGASTPIL